VSDNKRSYYYAPILALLPKEEEVHGKVLNINYADHDGEYSCHSDILVIAESREALAEELARIGHHTSECVYDHPNKKGEVKFFIFEKEIEFSAEGDVVSSNKEGSSAGFIITEFFIPKISILT
jgi:hypothetical protein